ncbi:MAG: 6-bladed beta-propeller [Chloroflexota bacterium]|nr:6-bladed beta-propeller [Chloroflexota bacterium]
MNFQTNLSLILSTVVFLLAGSAPVLAQAPMPDHSPEEDLDLVATDPVDEREYPWQPPLNLKNLPESRATTVSLGDPGLSFSYLETLGTTGSPYHVDSLHLNRPMGMTIDDTGAIYVVEEAGFRMQKFDAAGIKTLSIGQAGQPGFDDDLLATPEDVALDSDESIWIVAASALRQFDANGSPLQTFPSSSPWTPGSSNSRFRYPRGVAFDSTGQMYVADSGNHRVQVYSLSGGTPGHVATIGVTGEPGSDSAHFNLPSQIVLDSADQLYVADTDNYRVQRCVLAGAWTCTTFHGTGSQGNGVDTLDFVLGIGIDNNDNLFIADTGNGRVKRCTPAGNCTSFASEMIWPGDIVADSFGNIFIGDLQAHTIRKYSHGGTLLAIFAGTGGIPYAVDQSHFNGPWGVGTGADGKLFVLENPGYRMVKLDSDGLTLWAAGEAGIFGDDNEHFGDYWGGPEGNVGIDATGRAYISDTTNHRVQVFNSDGSFNQSVGGQGTGNQQFNCPSGVAINPTNDDILVADRCNERVQIYDSNWNYRLTLGETGQPGSDHSHFRWPSGVAVSSQGIIYIADSNNQRIQQCLPDGQAYDCGPFAGETGVFSDDFGHLHPIAVAVGQAGRVYAVDQWNNRVQVFDATGAYLTTIGGETGTGSGRLRNPAGVAANQVGTIYVADQENHRVQKFMTGVPSWVQVNINGFGQRWSTGVSALEPFDGQLFAATSDWEQGSRIWKSTHGSDWLPSSEWGFTDPQAAPAVVDMQLFHGDLYASTGWGDTGAQVWRSFSGTSWSKVVKNGFSNGDNVAITALAVFDDTLYAATQNDSGAEIWRSGTGNNGSWTRVVTAGFNGDSSNNLVSDLFVFEEKLYAAVENNAEGAELWRTDDGASWEMAAVNGLGDPDNIHFGSMALFDNWLYISTRNDSTGGQIWRSPNGSLWLPTMVDGFGDPDNFKVEALLSFDSELIAVTTNFSTGLEVWHSSDGSVWNPMSPKGFGDNNNDATLWANAIANFDGGLHLGTWNWANGGELWRYRPQDLFLPVVNGR